MYEQYLEADPIMEFGIARMLAWPNKIRVASEVTSRFTEIGVIEVERFPDTPEVVLERFRLIT